MRAWVIDAFEGLGRLKLEEVSEPVAGAGEVVLEVSYAGLNPADRYLAQGEYPAKPKLPHILGRDGVGTVVAVGDAAGPWKVGDRALILRGEVGVDRAGTFAQRVAVPVDTIVSMPEGWSEAEAAGAPLVYLTAYQALMQWGALPASVVLVTGASGGVGVASVQLGRAMGHTMIGLSRSTEKRERLMELGAAGVFDPEDAEWRKALKRFLGERRVDLAIDNVGGELFGGVIETLGMWGKVSVVGRLAGPVPSFNTSAILFRRIRIGGVAVGVYTREQALHSWEAISALMREKGLRPLVDRVFGFEELVGAFERLGAGPMGKVVVRVGRNA